MLRGSEVILRIVVVVLLGLICLVMAILMYCCCRASSHSIDDEDQMTWLNEHNGKWKEKNKDGTLIGAQGKESGNGMSLTNNGVLNVANKSENVQQQGNDLLAMQGIAVNDVEKIWS